MSETTQKIKLISGAEPRRDGEYPEVYLVGSALVTRIEVREQNMGTYGIMWFDVYGGETLIASMNAAHVVSVTYFPEDHSA